MAAALDVVDMRMGGPGSSVDTEDSHTFPAAVGPAVGRRNVCVAHGSAAKPPRPGSWIVECDIPMGMGAASARLPSSWVPLRFALASLW